MEIGETILYIMELIGIVAAAVSGAMTAVDNKLDPVGVVFLGAVTALGGGVTRDIIIGRFPPVMFSSMEYVAAAAVTSFAVYVFAYIFKEKYACKTQTIDNINNIFDAIGLGAFTMVGTETAILFFEDSSMFFCVFTGVLTGIGGGFLRDLIVNRIPVVLRKKIYMIASVFGAIAYYILSFLTKNKYLSSFCCIAIVFTIRMLSTHFRWRLPPAIR